ncbi:MAG: septum formation protein Maf [Leptolyngbya sp. PLA3]|nr:MAG: septum formation protein Maf [Cyanobacteria bacterium CYA]MCE7968978.1 septum formation protein Maf [Leptolyngbya sp. PL-A3]
MCLDATQDPLPPVALASRSPRRRELLTSHGVRHEVIDADIDDAELAPGDRDPRSWVMALAYLKAQAGALGSRDAMLLDGTVFLGADTVCVKDGQIIGQPADEADARRILHLFRDTDHEVLTGVALLDTRTGQRDMFVDVARVHVGHVSDQQIEDYLASGHWRGKAGAYNLSERLEAGWPITYQGDPTSIMGLPMEALTARLSRFAGHDVGE